MPVYRGTVQAGSPVHVAFTARATNQGPTIATVSYGPGPGGNPQGPVGNALAPGMSWTHSTVPAGSPAEVALFIDVNVPPGGAADVVVTHGPWQGQDSWAATTDEYWWYDVQ